jgi:cysteinyl-tRNA synthetase
LGRKVVELFGVLGIVPSVPRSVDVAGDEWVADLIDRRDRARAAKDFATADAIRSELEGAGWVVEDAPDGTRIHH